MIQVKEFESVYGIDDKINKWLCDNKNIEVIVQHGEIEPY